LGDGLDAKGLGFSVHQFVLHEKDVDNAFHYGEIYGKDGGAGIVAELFLVFGWERTEAGSIAFAIGTGYQIQRKARYENNKAEEKGFAAFPTGNLSDLFKSVSGASCHCPIAAGL
jgi:hypothetical protein